MANLSLIIPCYNEEKNIKVLRIKGTDMETTIKSTQ